MIEVSKCRCPNWFYIQVGAGRWYFDLQVEVWKLNINVYWYRDER